ncbi:MAG: BREX-4 system phosphatase PglZ [Syntrophomonas sp.]
MTLQEIMQRLAVEKNIGSRFPVRVIFVDSIKQYNELILSLSQACDATLQLASFCAGPDVFPNFRNVLKEIDKYPGKQILILSVSEYLRLGIKQELMSERSQIPALWERQQNASSKTRIIIPMLSCRELWDRVIPQMDERQRQPYYAWTLDSGPSDMDTVCLEIYSQEFQNVIPNDKAVHGMQEWLYEWNEHMNKSNGKRKIVTKLWKYAENVTAIIETKIISDVFEYISSVLKDGNILKKEWGTNEEWLSLLPAIKEGVSITYVIEDLLNVRSFDPLSLLAQWDIMSSQQLWLVWLWYRINGEDNYYDYAIKQAPNHLSIPKQLSYSIFDVATGHPEWIEQRTNAMLALKVAEPGDEFFYRVDSLPLMETRLKLLTCTTHSEKTYAIKTISQWLRKDVDIDAVSDCVTDKFPLLSKYLSISSDAYNSELKDYFSWYRKHKVMNIFPDNAEDKVQTIPLDSFNSRYSVLKQLEDKDAVVLWIDAMGAEWLPLLMECLSECSTGDVITSKVVKSILPTETTYNDQWKSMGIKYRKLDKLDILAHKGMPDDKDYFSCIAHQLNEIKNVAKTAINLLQENDYVAITADHGTSRLAALAFHNSPGISAPSGAKVKSYGRYCELDQQPEFNHITPGTLSVVNNDHYYLVFNTHGHYAQSGNAAGKNDDDNAKVGEVHGGATPEEVLVPVIILKRKTPLQKLEPILLTPTVYRNKSNATIKIQLNRPVVKLSVSAGDIKGICTSSEDGTVWSILFEGIGVQSYVLQIEADGKLLDFQPSFLVKSKGISQNDDMLGGL